nr:integrase, catalytic region, zinc finger, CCHC-type, peptidase aspartic, catalytic [Tanacetum cinerariifolium]
MSPHLGPEPPRIYSDLSPEEKDRYNADIRATNILLQGLPKDIYTLINHYTDAKDIWDNVKMILEGSKLTKEDRESQLYDDFEHFRQNQGETIHAYYVRFAKLINDMRNIKMTMSRMQLNSKFVNNMLPEWDNLIENLTNMLALLTQSYKTFLPQTNNQLKTSSNTKNQATVQDGRVMVQNVQGRLNRGQGNNPRGGGAAGYKEHITELGMLIQADDCDAFDFDVDEAPTAQTMFMANLSSANPVYDADEDVTLVDVDTAVEMDADTQGRMEKDVTDVKEINATESEPTVLNDDENVVAEQMQEKHLNNIKKYQSLKRKPISVAQARKNMIVYLKNMAGYKIQYFKGMTYDQESFKKLRAEVKVSGSHSTQQDTPTVDPAEISKEDVQNLLQIFLIAESIQVKGPTDALQITPVNNNNPFSSPPTHDALINFVNNLGYPKVVKTLSAVVTNDMFQPWRALTTIINLCLTRKTSGFERPRAPVLQILWGIVNRAHIDYAERMWEEFTQSIHSFVEDKKNLALHTQGKKKSNPIVIPSIRFTKLIIHHLQSKHKFHLRPDSPLHLPYEEYILGYLKFSAKGTKREVFGMPILNELITADIRGERYYKEYLKKVAKHQRYLAGEEESDLDSPAPKPAKATKKSKPSAPKAAPITKHAPAKAFESTSSQQHTPKPAPAKTQEKKCKLVAETSDEPSLAKSSKSGKVTKRHKPTISLILVDEFVDEGIPEREPRFDDDEADIKRAVKECLKSVHDAHRGPLPPVVIREPDFEKFQPLPKIQGKGKEKRRTPAPTEPSGHAESPSIYTELWLTDSDIEFDEEVPHVVKIRAQDEGQARPNPGVLIEGHAGSNLGDDAEPQPQSSLIVPAGPDLEHIDLEATDVSTQQNPEQMDEGFTTTAYPNVQENLKLTIEEQVILEERASSTRTLSSLQHLTKDFSFGDQFFNNKPSEAENEKTTVETEAESMPLQATTTKTTTTTTTTHPPPPQPQQSTTNSILIKCIGKLEQIMENLIQDNKHLEERLDSHGSRLYTLENLDIPQQNRFRDLPEPDMKEILHQHMWETNSYKAHKDHMMLYKAMEKSMNHDHSDELLKDLVEAQRKKKKRHDLPKTPPGSPPHQPPPPPPPAAASAEYTAWKTTDTRLRPSVSSIPKDLHMDDDTALDEQVHSSDDEDIRNAHIPKTSDMAIFIDWFYKQQGITGLKPQDLEGPAFKLVKVFHPNVIHLQYQMEECHKLLTDNVDESIIRHTSEGDRRAVRTHMWILSVVRIKVFSMYAYDYMKMIVFRRVDLNEHIIAERDFKYLYISDFEYLYLLNLQGHLNHLPPKDKEILTTAVNLWTRHLVIRQRVKDFQLGIESYQTQLNLTKPRWDAIGFKYKQDFTVIDSPRAVTFRDTYGVQMIMRFNEIHKFSDGTLHQIDEALDYQVKEFKINRINLSLNTRFWTRKDVDRSKEFMFAIQTRLKTMRIFRNLESFVGGKVREEDYRLLQRTE